MNRLKKVLVDRSRLEQILLNFIINAIKYNKPNGSIEFGCIEIEDDSLWNDKLSEQPLAGDLLIYKTTTKGFTEPFT
jgi:signal transduction histidine kinase